MYSHPCVRILLLAISLTACHKQTRPTEADMDAASRQKAIAIREAADKETAELQKAAAIKAAADKAAAAKAAAAVAAQAAPPAPSSVPASPRSP